MPRGARYHIPKPAYTKGPQKTISAMNADAEKLQDIAERVADIEDELDGPGGGYVTVDFCNGGLPYLIDIRAKNIRPDLDA